MCRGGKGSGALALALLHPSKAEGSWACRSKAWARSPPHLQACKEGVPVGRLAAHMHDTYGQVPREREGRIGRQSSGAGL